MKCRWRFLSWYLFISSPMRHFGSASLFKEKSSEKSRRQKEEQILDGWKTHLILWYFEQVPDFSTFLHESCSETLMGFHGHMRLQINQFYLVFLAAFSTKVNEQLWSCSSPDEWRKSRSSVKPPELEQGPDDVPQTGLSDHWYYRNYRETSYFLPSVGLETSGCDTRSSSLTNRLLP